MKKKRKETIVFVCESEKVSLCNNCAVREEQCRTLCLLNSLFFDIVNCLTVHHGFVRFNQARNALWEK